MLFFGAFVMPLFGAEWEVSLTSMGRFYETSYNSLQRHHLSVLACNLLANVNSQLIVSSHHVLMLR